MSTLLRSVDLTFNHLTSLFGEPQHRAQSQRLTYPLIMCLLVTASTLAIFSSACTPPPTSYRLLSDEVISLVKSPPYSREQVRQAQASLRWRIANRLQTMTIQSELKSFACLIVAQRLDPMTARGERAPSQVPCVANPKAQCPHGCKRSRLPQSIILPSEYQDVARRHDQILWEDLKAIAEREPLPPWERYLTDCLACESSLEAKRLICERDLADVDLTAERVAYQPLDRWLNQCQDLPEPSIQALVTFRTFMLTPPEDLTYPLNVADLKEPLQAQLNVRAIIGEGIRLAVGSLDVVRIKALLNSDDVQGLAVPQWVQLRDQLKRRLDVELMPCLEAGIETCLDAGQVRITQRQAPAYIRECNLCEHRDAVSAWLDQVSLAIEPVWRSHLTLPTQVLLKRAHPAAIIINESEVLSRLAVTRQEEHLIWARQLIQDSRQGTLKMWPPRPQWRGAGRGRSPSILVSDRRQLYAIDPQDGATQWTYRFPFSQDGALIPCDRVDPIPSNAMSGRLSQGGALCYRRENLLFLNTLGEPILKLICPQELGCGELLSLTSTDPSPFKSELTLIMTHRQDARPSSRSLTLTRYDVSQLELMASALEQRSALSTSTRVWQGVSDVSGFRSSQPALLTLSTSRGILIVHLIDARTGAEIWRKSLGREAILQQPSAQLVEVMPTDHNQEPVFTGAAGILTRKRFVTLALDDGRTLRNERLPIRGRLGKRMLNTLRDVKVSWEQSNDRLTVLHPPNRRLYISDERRPLSKRSFSLKRLSPRASLKMIHDQWVVISPDYGEVFGITPQGDKLAWTWRGAPFNELDLGEQWALFHREDTTQLNSIFPLGADEISRSTEQTSTPTTSPCVVGDRWGCMIAGDELIGIDADLDLKLRSPVIRAWFEAQRDQREYERSVSMSRIGPPAPSLPRPLDALQAQSLWSSACQWGVAEACTRLGMLAELGLTSQHLDIPPKGVSAPRQAFKYYLRAENLGDPLASERLGEMNEKGLGTSQDYQRARAAYFKACESSLHLPHACARWGRLNELGLGGPVKLVTARTAYYRACQAQVEWACQRLKKQ